MRVLRKWAWATLIAAAVGTPVAAQQQTSTGATGGTTGTTSGATARTTTGTGGIAGGGMTAGTSLGGGSSLGSSSSGSTLPQIEAAPKITAPTGTASSSLDKTNRFAGYYANPYFQGNSNQTNTMPGGFGQATTAGTSSTGGRGGLGGGIGGRGGLGSQNSANQSGILIPLPVQIAYTARMQFETPPVAPTKIQGDIRAVIDNTTAIANSKSVQVITDANNNVTLRGSVKNDDERRLIEGLVRLTPGVGDIKNELSAPPGK